MPYLDGYRALIRMICILLAIPAFYYVTSSSIAYVTGPNLYDGDRLEERTCRECGGDGKDVGDPSFPIPGDRCIACRGKGKVQVIIPGPNRPTRIWGTVRRAEGPRSAEEEYVFEEPVGGRGQTLMTGFGAATIPGGIGKAAVRFFDAAGIVAEEIEANSQGGFSQRLAPGSYRVEVRKEGYETLELPLEVPMMKGAIWLEKAEIIREDMSEAESLSRFGMTIDARLAPRQSGYKSWGRSAYGSF